MSQQQLFCVADDRHRAVILAGCLADLGNPVVQVNQPQPPACEPALVFWTRRAARTPWLIALFERYPQTIALVVDDVPLPKACRRVLNLRNWPARSADASVGALVRWLQNPDQASVPFSPAGRDVRTAEPGNRLAYLVISACMALLIGLMITNDRSHSEQNPLAEHSPAGAIPNLAATRPGARPGSEQNLLVRTTAPPVLGGSPATHDTAPAAVQASRPMAGRLLARSGKSTAGNDSLSHLCRARTPEAALAWFRVLAPAVRRTILDIDCVQALLARPGFAALETEFQA